MMSLDQAPINQLITDNIDTWTSTVKNKATTGRGSSKKLELYGVKKLRELILELAVRGKLVPQDPTDDPASVLLERIANEKAQLVKDKKIKKLKKLPSLTKEDCPFELPDGWAFSQLANLSYVITKGTTPTSVGYDFTSSGVNFVKVENIDRESITNSAISQYISYETNEALARSSLDEGDILFSIAGTIGKTCLVKKSDLPANTNQALAIIKGTSTVFTPKFLLLQLGSFVSKKTRDKARGGAMPNVSLGDLSELVTIVPPMTHQHRIVAKVDELMTLCDQLEQQTEASIAAHQVLVTTLLDTLTNSANAEELMQNWQMVAEHFDTLFTTEESIDQLKQTILQLAVMGKLVPQDPTDEPAAKLLERIAKEKAQLIKDKKIKNQKALPPIADDEKPFELPNGWEWCRFEDVVEIHSGITKGRKLAGRELTTIPYLSVANVQRGYLNIENVKEIDLPVDELEKYAVKEGDLLITEGGDWDKVGRTATWRSEVPYMAHQNHVFKARPYLSEQSEIWLEMYLNGPFARGYFAGSSKQTTNLASINKTQLRSCLIAVPPSGEKLRITAKVQELVEICKLVQERIAVCQQTQFQLTDAIVEQAL